jgi:glycosyltransferase involved in cell wall biosynthesis
MGNRSTIGLAMIVKNEEERVGAALDSVKGLDELKVLDTGSTDKTGEVVRDHGGDFIEGYIWNQNYAEARNKSIRLCTTDWILYINAGERMDPGGVDELRRSIGLIEEGYPQIQGGDVLMYNAANPSDAFPGTRLIKNSPDICFNEKYRIHEYPNVLQKADLRDAVRVSFRPRPAGNGDYNERLFIIEQMVREDPHDLRLHYIAAREYQVNKFYPNAIYFYDRYLRTRTEKAFWNERAELADVYFSLALCLYEMREWKPAKVNLALALTVNADFKEAAQLLAKIASEDVDDPNGELNAGRWAYISEAAQNRKMGFKSKGIF